MSIEEKLNVPLIPHVPQRLFRLGSWLNYEFLQEIPIDSSSYDQKEARVDIAQCMSYGPNRYLEDRIDYVSNFQGASNLTDQELQDTLSHTALDINKSIVEDKSYDKETGSTLVSTVCSKPLPTRNGVAEVKLSTISVGDSGAFVVVVDQEGKIVPQDNPVHVDAKSGEITYGDAVQCNVIRLNPKLHNPGPNAPDPQFRPGNNPNVIRDIKYTDQDLKIGGDISARGMPSDHYRLGCYEENRPLGSVEYSATGKMAVGTLVYNDIGAAKYKSDYNAVCKPDTYVNTIKIPPGGRAFVINCCDGATEGLDEEGVSERIQSAVTSCWNINHSFTALDLAKNLHTQARTENLEIYGENGGGSRDNISICVRAIAPTDTTATITSVYDGHGGEQVAEELRHKYNLKVECAVFKKALEKNRSHLDSADYQLQLNYLNDCLVMMDNFNKETYIDRRRQYYVDYLNLHPEQQQTIVQEYNKILQEEVGLNFLTPGIAEKEKIKFVLEIAEASDLQNKRPSRIGWSIVFAAISAFLFFSTLIPALHIVSGAGGMFDFFYRVADLTGGFPLIQLTLTVLSLIPTVAFIGHAYRGKLTSQEETNVEVADALAQSKSNLSKDQVAFTSAATVASSMSINTVESATPVASFSAVTNSSTSLTS